MAGSTVAAATATATTTTAKKPSKKKNTVGAFGLAESMTVVVDTPADFLWDFLMDTKALADAVQGVESLDPYDPHEGKLGRRKPSSKKSPQDKNNNKNDDDNANQNDPAVARAGACYMVTRDFLGQHIKYPTQYTRVGDGFVQGKRSFVTNCFIAKSTFTSTYVLEQMSSASASGTASVTTSASSGISNDGTSAANNNNNSADDNNSRSTNSSQDALAHRHSSCRWQLSWAMIPDTWQGKVRLWFARTKRTRALVEVTRAEVEDIKRAAEEKYARQIQEQAEATTVGGSI